MPTPVSLSRAEARRVALAAQGFAERRPTGRVDRRHLRKVMRRLELLQLDSVPVVIRTQYLPLFSRLGPYRAELLDAVAYPRPGADHEWFEAWSHEASLLPVEMEPWLRWSKRAAREGRTWRPLQRIAKEAPDYVDRVLAEVEARGPIAPGELEDPRPGSGEWWGSRSAGAWALDWLFRIGAVGVRRRPGFAKEYDLLERIVPDEVRSRPTPGYDESLDELLARAARAQGVASADCLVDYFRLPKRDAKARLPKLVEAGRLVPCRVEGWSRPAYLAPDARIPRSLDARALLSPFDPVVWCRPRIEALFDFEYRIEIYTPADKRRWGYYVLPFLMGDRLAARFDLKTDRARGVLEVRAAHLEPGESKAEVADAAARELAALARLVGVDRIRVGRRGNLAASLSRACRSLEGGSGGT